MERAMRSISTASIPVPTSMMAQVYDSFFGVRSTWPSHAPLLLSLGRIAMRVLFVVFVLCIAALVFTLMAFRRHIRKHDPQPGDSLPLTGSAREDSLNQNQ